MAKSLSIIIVAGARPNFMKISPIHNAICKRKQQLAEKGIEIDSSIIHTGQHYDENMSDVFFSDLRIPRPKKHLEVGSGTHAEQTGKIMIAFEKILREEKCDLVIVVGDVNSTIACSLTAKKSGLKVGHVEAGLRSFDMSMPEEINRKLTDAISDILFVTEESGVKNLRSEGIQKEKIFLVGNVMIDTLKQNLSTIDERGFVPSTPVRNFRSNGPRYAVLTLHRPSNVDRRETLLPIWSALTDVARQIPIVFPAHPRTRSRLKDLGLKADGMSIIEPIGYLDMLYVVKDATMVLTDSGGLQEETTFLGIPCVTIRENTERPITVELGTNYLAGTRPETILSAAHDILSGNAKKGAIPPLWDGHASERIVDILLGL